MEKMYRQTFVIEYNTPSEAPRVGSRMELLGGKLIAVQFSDALEEIEALQLEIDRLHQDNENMHSKVNSLPNAENATEDRELPILPEDSLDDMVERGTQAWGEVTNATDWIEILRGGKA